MRSSVYLRKIFCDIVNAFYRRISEQRKSEEFRETDATIGQTALEFEDDREAELSHFLPGSRITGAFTFTRATPVTRASCTNTECRNIPDHENAFLRWRRSFQDVLVRNLFFSCPIPSCCQKK